MSPLKNPKHEAFIQQYLVNGGNARAAYAHVYPDANEATQHSSASKLMATDLVRERMKECQDRLMQMTFATIAERREQLLNRLDKIINYEGVPDAPRQQDILKAIELQMRALGMLDPQEGKTNNIILNIEGAERMARGDWLDKNNPQSRPANGSD